MIGNSSFVEVRNLSKQFVSNGNKVDVFNNISFDFSLEQTVCFLGPTGCGKSTLLKCLAGITSFHGEVKIGGRNPKELSKKKEIGFVFQEAGLIPWKNVFDNILLPSEIGEKLISKTEAKNRAEELLEMVGLERYRSFFPSQMSGGMKQRTSLARALLLRPELIIMDEPYGQLDSLTRTKIIIQTDKILKKYKATCVLVTHNIEEAVYLANKIFILRPRPTAIVHSIDVDFPKEGGIGLFDNPEFISKIAACRKILFSNEK